MPLWLETDSHQRLTFAASIVDCGAAAAGSPPGERRPCRTDMSGFRQAPKKLLECRSGTQDCLWKSSRMGYVTQISLPAIDGGGNLFKAFRKAEALQGCYPPSKWCPAMPYPCNNDDDIERICLAILKTAERGTCAYCVERDAWRRYCMHSQLEGCKCRVPRDCKRPIQSVCPPSRGIKCRFCGQEGGCHCDTPFFEICNPCGVEI